MGNVLVPRPQYGALPGTSFGEGLNAGAALGNALRGTNRDDYWKAKEFELKERELDAETKAGKYMTPGAKALETKLATDMADDYDSVLTRGEEADAKLADLNRLSEIRKKYGYENMGPLSGIAATAEGWFGQGYGQEIRSIATKLQLDLTQKTKGAISDREMALFGQSTPGLDMSDQAAENIIQAQRAVRQREKVQANFYRQWQAQYGTPQGAREAWGKYVRDNPIFSGSGLEDMQTNADAIAADPSQYLQVGPQGAMQLGPYNDGLKQQGAKAKLQEGQVVYDPSGRAHVVRNNQLVPQ